MISFIQITLHFDFSVEMTTHIFLGVVAVWLAERAIPPPSNEIPWQLVILSEAKYLIKNCYIKDRH